MCQGLEVEGSRYETGVIRVWFGYDSRSTIQHTVSDLDRSYNGQSAPEAGRCKRYRLPQWATAASQHRSCLQPTCLHMAARLRGWRAGWRKGRLKAAWSYSGLSAPKLSSTYLAPKGSMKCRDPWSPNNNHQQALKNDNHLWGLLRGMLRGYASGCASGVCFARAPPSTNTYLGPREKNTNPYIHMNTYDHICMQLSKTYMQLACCTCFYMSI